MPTLSESRIEELLQPYICASNTQGVEILRARRLSLPDVLPRLSAYLDLLVRWNARTNLTAVRDPEMIVQRHFGESLFTANCLAGLVPGGSAVLDFGSGAGFPGLPTQLLLPQVHVTLAESQHKKAAFLRVAVRELGAGAEVWSGRVEDMPAERLFAAVMMRAVDNPALARALAVRRVQPGGYLLELGPRDAEGPGVDVPGGAGGRLLIYKVPVAGGESSTWNTR